MNYSIRIKTVGGVSEIQPLQLFDSIYTFCLALGISFLLLSSCGTMNTGSNTMSKITLTEADKGKFIEVHKGDEIVIQLKENPTTGYRWAVDKTDNTVLALQNLGFSPTPGTGIGGGGTRTFTFIVKQPGTVQLQLKLWREWQGDSSIIDRYDVTLRVG